MILTRAAIWRPAISVPAALGAGAAALVVASSWVSPLLMPVVAGLILLVVVTLRHPWLGLALLVASVPVQQIGAVAGVTATRVALIVALAVWAASLLAGRNPVRGTRLTIL
ncbi:MAG TPA: hypothetical protein PKA95_13545, partial [Thermomicrobiales bacterium]|nr:hypothetical protein [Thermomicrobiales bacterium]